jgi:hypothetical protein
MVVFLYEREDRTQVRAALPKGNSAKKTHAIRNLLDDLDKMDAQLGLAAAAQFRGTPPKQQLVLMLLITLIFLQENSIRHQCDYN